MMRNLIYKGFVIDASEELVPSIRISPFRNINHLSVTTDTSVARKYLNERFKGYSFFPKGRDAIAAALKYYHLRKDDVVSILTTSRCHYISSCVTKEIETICSWSRCIEEKTKVIFINHEFGYPLRSIEAIAGLGFPIIEDCAHTFFATDTCIGQYSDFVIYSLPKAFPMQMGAILKTNKSLGNYSDNKELEEYVLSNLSIHVPKIDEYMYKRRENFCYLCTHLADLGITPFFDDRKSIPGVFLFKWKNAIGYPELKSFMQRNGVESSVFYGQDAFFIPVHQELKQNELDYMVNLIHYFYENANE